MTTNGTHSYPVFRPNQVLTDEHLNNAVSYLEAQTRLTRATLIGTGIICGFQPSLRPATKAVAVTQGCGITTEGYLVVEAACTLTHYRRATLVTGDLPGIDGDFQPVVHELFSSATPDGLRADPTNPIVALDEAQDDDGTALWPSLPGKIVVLLLHVEDEERDICLFDCDEAGARRTFHVRKLVMDPGDAGRILRSGFGLADGINLDRVFNRSYYLPDLTLKRFGFVGRGSKDKVRKEASVIDLSRITSLEAYRIAFERVCGVETLRPGVNPLFNAIAIAYQRADELFSPFFSGALPRSTQDFARLEETLHQRFDEVRMIKEGVVKQLGIQYFYDYLKDLILAYNELKAVTFDLIDDCLPPSGRYPRHLMLGGFGSDTCPPSVYRTGYTQPPIYNGNARRVKEVQLLYARMQNLAIGFRLPMEAEGNDIKVTLSRLSPAPLGTRAIPFYYDPESKPYRSWDFERSRRCRAWQNQSYHPLPMPKDQQGPTESPLVCDIDPYDFYRIEGHVGHSYEDALRGIQALRGQNNLAFDVIALKIGLVADSDNIQYNFVFEDLEASYSRCKKELRCVLTELEAGREPPKPVRDAIAALKDGLTRRPKTKASAVKGQDIRVKDGDEIPQDAFLFGDFYNLTRLSEDTHFGDFSRLHDVVFSWVKENQLPYIDCCPETAQLLLDAYTRRVEEIQQQLLFHRYAQTHPGVEHLAGVPRGGTFILVYVNEGEEEVLREVERRALEKASDANAEARALLLGGKGEEVKKALKEMREASRRGVEALKERSDEAVTKLEEARSALAAAKGKGDAVTAIDDLIAAEMASRTNTVVGDFCLPYRCCGDAPSFSIVVAQPRPIVLLEEVSYCENDAGPYAFFLHPENGLLEGPGVDSSSGRYTFIPSHPDVQRIPFQNGQKLITFTYFADGGTDTLTVEILPPRDAGFTDLPDTICIVPANPEHPNNQPIALERNVPGGTFTPDGPPLEERDGKVFFNPMTAPLGEPVAITYTVPAGDDGCSNAETQTVTVVEAPDAGFTFGSDDQTTFCTTDEPVMLIPNVPAFGDGFSGEGVIDGPLFDPSRVDGGGQAMVEITHEVIDEGTGCRQSLIRTVTVFRQPDASFELEQTVFCVGQAPEEVALPTQKGSVFSGRGVSGSVFRPAEVPIPADEMSATARITHTITIGTCTDTFFVDVTVFRTAEAGFVATFGVITEEQFQVVINDIKPEAAERYIWRNNIRREVIELGAPDDPKLTFFWEEVSNFDLLNIVLQATNGPCRGVFEHPPLTIPPRPDPGGETRERGELNVVLNRRTEGFRDSLTVLAEENANLNRTRSFASANAFVALDASTSPDEVVERYAATVDTMRRGLRQTTDPQRQQAFRQMIEVVTHSLFDRITVTAPSETGAEVVKRQVEQLREVGIDLDALRRNWKAGDLRDVVPSTDVDRSLALLG